MGDPKTKRSHSRPKKRHAYNKKTKTTPTVPLSAGDCASTSSAKKLSNSKKQQAKYPESDNDLGYGFADLNLLVSMIVLFPCPECLTKGRLSVSVKSLGGQALRIVGNCGHCDAEIQQDLSQKITL